MNFDNLGIDPENMDFGDMLEHLSESIKKMKDMSDKVITDKISVVPMKCWYHIQTGPHVLSKNPDAYVTVLAVESFDHKHESSTCGVQTYESREEAIEGHDYWRRAMMDNPIRIMKDAVTGEVVTIDF